MAMNMAKIHRCYVNDSSLGHTGSLILFLIFGFLNFNFLKWKPHPLSQDRKAQRQLEWGLELEGVRGVEEWRSGGR